MLVFQWFRTFHGGRRVDYESNVGGTAGSVRTLRYVSSAGWQDGTAAANPDSGVSGSSYSSGASHGQDSVAWISTLRGSGQSSVYVGNSHTGVSALVHTFPGQPPMWDCTFNGDQSPWYDWVAYSPMGDRLLVATKATCLGPYNIHLYDLRTGHDAIVWSGINPNTLYMGAAAFSEDGKEVVLRTSGQAVLEFRSLRTGNVVRTETTTDRGMTFARPAGFAAVRATNR